VARPLRDLGGTALVLFALAGIVGDHAEAALDASREGGQQSAQPAPQPQQQPATDEQRPVWTSSSRIEMATQSPTCSPLTSR
jgi:hypothetical protein